MGDLPETVEQLSHRVDELERRVAALEHPVALARPEIHPAAATAAQETALAQPGGVIAVLGKAMLGIAGAYLLRAVEGLGTVPGIVMAAIAIAYAVAWLVWAAREEGRARLAGAIYAGASALILAPMLWELVERFTVISPSAAAAVLVVYPLLASVLAWRHLPSAVYWIAHSTSAAASLALGIATHLLEPFLVVLLVLVLINEYAATRGRESAIRPLVSLATAAAVWAFIFVYSGPPDSRSDYPALSVAGLLAPACVLFALNAAGIAIRTIRMGQPARIVDEVQAVIALLLAASSVLLFAPRSGQLLLGLACLVLSAGCYAASFVVFRRNSQQRNYIIFAVWSAGLFLAGVFWSMPRGWMSLSLGGAAITAVAIGTRLNIKMLELQGVLYLAAAAAASGMMTHGARALVGPMPAPPTTVFYLAAICALACYAIAREREGEEWQRQVLHFVPAFLATLALAALMAQGLVRLVSPGATPSVYHVAFIRTLTVCALALALALGGSRLHRAEMTRIAYAALAFVAAKLLFEDLRHGRMEFIAASIFLFAVTLIAVPRMGHRT